MTNATQSASDFTAQIGWGDGTVDDGTIVASGNGFTVTGNHTYVEPGNFAVWVTVTGPLPVRPISTSADIRVAVESSNVHFVRSLYGLLLNRLADADGLAFWSGLLDAGTSRTRIVSAFQDTTEHRTFEIEWRYQRDLGRDADPVGLDKALRFLNGGGTVQELETGILSSVEYLAKHGGGDIDAYIDAVSRAILNRAAGPVLLRAGRHVLEGAADVQSNFGGGEFGATIAGAPPSAAAGARLVTILFASDEYARRAVLDDYFVMLVRFPDEDTVNSIARLLEFGMPREQLVAAILASDEMKTRLDS